MLKENIFTYLFLFLGIGLVTVGLLLSKTYKKSPASAKVIAQLERLTGEVVVIKKSKTHRNIVAEKVPLSPLDTVETNNDGKADFTFPSGEKIRILGNSKVIVDEENFQTVVLIQKGDIEVQTFAEISRTQSPQVLLSFQGQRMNLKEWEIYKKNKVLSYEEKQKSLNSYQSGQRLSESYVSQMIQTHKAKFLQCYNKLLQKTPGLSGSVTLSFTIEKSGKISNSHTASAQLTDVDFKSCIHEVLKRIEFKAFEGEPISTVIPLNFE